MPTMRRVDARANAGEGEAKDWCVMATLYYMTQRGGCIGTYGTCAALGLEMVRLKRPATLRNDQQVIVGESTECDGTCDEPSECGGWHWWYDPTGDNLTPDEGGMSRETELERG